MDDKSWPELHYHHLINTRLAVGVICYCSGVNIDHCHLKTLNIKHPKYIVFQYHTTLRQDVCLLDCYFTRQIGYKTLKYMYLSHKTALRLCDVLLRKKNPILSFIKAQPILPGMLRLRHLKDDNYK